MVEMLKANRLIPRSELYGKTLVGVDNFAAILLDQSFELVVAFERWDIKNCDIRGMNYRLEYGQ